MSPTPVTFTTPTAPVDLQLGGDRRGGRRALRRPDRATIVRFDLNTSPTPPALVGRLLAAGRFEAPLSEYPPSDYRRLVEAAAARYGVSPDEILVGAGADEILDLVAKAFIAGRRRGRRPDPDLRDVPRPDRAARRDGRRRPAARRGRRLGARRRRRPRRPRADAARRLAVQPEQPDRPGRARRRDRGAPRRPRRRRRGEPARGPDRRPRRGLCRVRRVVAASACATAYPNLIVVRTASKAYALAGLRVGFAVARPEVIARLNPYRPPGSVSTVSVTVVTEALLDHGDPRRQPRARRARARAPDRRLCARPAGRSGRRSPTSSSSTSGRRSGPRPSPRGSCARGLVPRTFGAGPPARRPPAPHRPRPGRERPAHRGRRSDLRPGRPPR